MQEVQYITDEKDEKKKKAAFGRKKIAWIKFSLIAVIANSQTQSNNLDPLIEKLHLQCNAQYWVSRLLQKTLIQIMQMLVSYTIKRIGILGLDSLITTNKYYKY